MAKRTQMDRSLVQYALQGIEAGIEKLQRQAAELRRMLGRTGNKAARGRAEQIGGTALVASAGGGQPYPYRAGAEVARQAQTAKKTKRTMSKEARRRISEAQKKRWAKQKGEAGETPSGRRGARKKR